MTVGEGSGWALWASGPQVSSTRRGPGRLRDRINTNRPSGMYIVKDSGRGSSGRDSSLTTARLVGDGWTTASNEEWIGAGRADPR